MRAILFTTLGTLTACAGSPPEPHIADVARAVCPPPQLFAHAVCTCEDLSQVGELHVKAGPAGVGSVGVNGRTELVDDADVAGTWFAYGGFSGVGVSVGDSLVTPGDVEITGEATIANDLVVGGDLTVTGSLSVDGTARVGGSDEDVVGEIAIANRAAYEGAGDPPCGCDEATLFDVATAVLAAKQASAGEVAWDNVGATELHLPTGAYYVTSAEIVGEATFEIEGNVSVFVDGSLDTVGDAQWKLAPGASLDLFVAGNVTHVGSLSAGDESRPGAFRLYVGGSGATEVAAVGTTAFFGSLYAPRAAVVYVGDARIVGSVFARTIESVGALTVEYGDPLTTPQSCETPPGPGPLL